MLINISLLKRNRNYRLLFIGQFISFFGTMITSVALPYQIYKETHSTLMVGLLSLFQLIPLLITALLGGVLADRKHRQLLLIISEVFLACGSILLALNASFTSPSLLLIFATAIFMSGFTGLHRPALESMVQQIVAKEDFPAVSALTTFTYSVGMIAGPAVAGLLIASVGLVTTFIVDLISFIISLIALINIKNVPPPKIIQEKNVLTSLIEGVRYAKSRQELLGTYFVDFVAMIFGMPMALFPAIAHSYGSVKVLGFLYAAPAVGALVISFFSGWLSKVTRHGAAVACSAVLWGVAIIFFGLSKNLYAGLFFLALAGAFDAVSGMFRQIMWNETIPNEYRGRLAGIEMISYMSGPKLGDTEAGLVAAAFGVSVSIISGGVLCIVGVVVCCYFLPRFWTYQSQLRN